MTTLERLAVALSMLAGAACQTSAIDDAAIPVPNQPFPDQQAALACAAQYALAASVTGDREYGGVLLRYGEGHVRLTLSAAPAHSDRIRIRIPADNEGQPVALWHTHGAPGPGRDWFSADDVGVVRETGLPFYLITPSGTLRVIEPGRFGRLPRSGSRSAALIGVTGYPVAWKAPGAGLEPIRRETSADDRTGLDGAACAALSPRSDESALG